jgi:hypothetical protein
MKLYLVHGQDLLLRTFRALIVSTEEEEAASNVIAHEDKGFHIDEIETIRDYPNLKIRPAIIARITLPEASE